MKKRRIPLIEGLIATAACLVLSACGSSVGDLGFVGGNGEPQAVVDSGVFKDSAVSGLSYFSGTQSGVTNTNGSFTFEVGSTITFTFGNIQIGSTFGKKFISPLDFGSSGGITDPRVLNITRFLLLMDDNGNPNGGIQISQKVQNMAFTKNWQIDFGSNDLDTQLAPVITDLNTITDETHILRDADFAKAHLDNTMKCTYSGAFTADYIGQDTGKATLYIDSHTGNAYGWITSTGSNGFFELDLNTPVAPIRFDLTGASIIETDGNTDPLFKALFSFSDIDQIDGNFSVTHAGLTLNGTLTGTRLDKNQTSTARFTGYYTDSENTSTATEFGVISFGVDEKSLDDIRVGGVIYSVVRNKSNQFTGTLLVNSAGSSPTFTLNAQNADNSQCFQGDLDFSTGTMSGKWYTACTSGVIGGPGSTPAGTFTGTGCQLN